MATLDDFVGKWRAEEGAPYSTHTFTWEPSGTGLSGAWIIEATVQGEPSPTARGSFPKRLEMQIGKPTLEENRLLFEIEGSLGITEFRLIGPSEATLGAAADKLPAEWTGPEFRRSIEGHRVRLTRHTEPVAYSESEVTP